MDYLRLLIHPNGDSAAAEIGEAVHELGGVLTEKKLLGMLHFEARFVNDDSARTAMRALELLDCVSHVGWIE